MDFDGYVRLDAGGWDGDDGGEGVAFVAPAAFAGGSGFVERDSVDGDILGRPVGGQAQFVGAVADHAAEAAFDGADFDAEHVVFLRGLDGQAGEGAALVVDGDAGVFVDRIAAG